MTHQNQESLRKAVQKAREMNSERRSSLELRTAVCRAVRDGLPVGEASALSGFGKSTIQKWLAKYVKKNEVRILAVRDEAKNSAEQAVCEGREPPLATLEFGTFSLCLFARVGR